MERRDVLAVGISESMHSVLVERLFAWPGTGRLLAEAVFSRDVPVVLGTTLLTGLAGVAASTAADLVSAWLDPRLGSPLAAASRPAERAE